MLNPLLCLGIARKIGWRGWFLILLALAMLFLWTRGNRFKGKYTEQLQVNHALQWDLSLAAAKLDSLKGIGQYVEIRVDSVGVPVPGPAEYDTVFLEAGETGPGPEIISQVRIDTSKWFGPEGERFGVRVYGLFHWPEEFSYRNRLLIDPLGFEKPPERPLTPRSKNWGIALASAISSQQRLYGGVRVAIKKTSVFGLRSLSGSDWMVGVQYDLLTF